MEVVKWFVEIVERRPILGIVAVLAFCMFTMGTYILTQQSELTDLKSQYVMLDRSSAREKDSLKNVIYSVELRHALDNLKKTDSLAKELKRELENMKEDKQAVEKLVSETNSITRSNTKAMAKLKTRK